MSKIVQAMNVMIAHPELIEDARKGKNGELFFRYKKKYIWGMIRHEDLHRLFYYPDQQDIKLLASFDSDDWENAEIEMVIYKESDIRTREAKDTFAALFTLLNEKIFGINDVLDDILSDDDIPF